MVRYKGASPYVQFVELGKPPYPGQPTIPGYSADEWSRAFAAVAEAMPSARDLMLMSEQSPEIVQVPAGVRLYLDPPLRKPTVRPIAVIAAEIRRATVPGLRPEDV